MGPETELPGWQNPLASGKQTDSNPSKATEGNKTLAHPLQREPPSKAKEGKNKRFSYPLPRG